jgi:hypothetical protein
MSDATFFTFNTVVLRAISPDVSPGFGGGGERFRTEIIGWLRNEGKPQALDFYCYFRL